MPRINVTEQDLSWYYRQRGIGPGTVYIPGIATFGPSDEPVLCTADNFTNVFGTSAVKIDGELSANEESNIPTVRRPYDISYDMAASIVQAGFNVLFHRFLPSGATTATAVVGDAPPDGQNYVTFKARYPGSFGNKISLQIRRIMIEGMISIYIYADSTLVETRTVNLINATATDYYTQLESDYITIEVTGDASQIMSSFGNASSPTSISLGVAENGGVTGVDYSGEPSALLDEIRAAITTEGALDMLTDPYQFDFDVIMAGGWSNYVPSNVTSIDPVDLALYRVACARGNSVFLVDGNFDWEENTLYTYCGLFDGNVTVEGVTTYMNGSYAAAFGPWGYQQFLSSGVTQLLPGSYTMVVAWAQSCASGNPLWMAPAGVKRATLGSFYKSTIYPVGKTVLDMWQMHDYVQPNSYSINPIMRAKSYGYVVYGNSTLLKSRDDGATSMLQSFSVRVLANLIKTQAFYIALGLQFDQLTDSLYIQFKTLMGTYLDQLKYNDALYDYSIVKGNATLTSIDLNQRTVPVTIRISPTPAAENFDILLEVSQAGVTFTDETDETEIA